MKKPIMIASVLAILIVLGSLYGKTIPNCSSESTKKILFDVFTKQVREAGGKSILTQEDFNLIGISTVSSDKNHALFFPTRFSCEAQLDIHVSQDVLQKILNVKNGAKNPIASGLAQMAAAFGSSTLGDAMAAASSLELNDSGISQTITYTTQMDDAMRMQHASVMGMIPVAQVVAFTLTDEKRQKPVSETKHTARPSFDDEDRKTIAAAVDRFFEVFSGQMQGMLGVQSEVFDCYKKIEGRRALKDSVFCLALDTQASSSDNALAKRLHVPPLFTNDEAVFEKRVRDHLSKAGVNNTNDQTDIIRFLRSETNEAAGKYVERSKANDLAAKEKKENSKPSLTGQLNMKEIDALRHQIIECWESASPKIQDRSVPVEVLIEVNRDQTIKDIRVVNQSRMDQDARFRTVADSALRALRSFKCQTLNLPPEKYEIWKTIRFNFDPSDLPKGSRSNLISTEREASLPTNLIGKGVPPSLIRVISNEDWPFVSKALQFAFSLGKKKEAVNWENTATGTTGSVYQSGDGESPDGCRQFRVTNLSTRNAISSNIDVCSDGGYR